MNSKHYFLAIRLIFVLCVLAVFAFVLGGSLAMRGSMYLSDDFLLSSIDYMKYSFADLGSRGFLAAGVGMSRESGEAEPTKVAASVPVLLYHSLVDEPDGIHITAKNFHDQMAALKKDGWQTITLADFKDYLAGKKVPDKSFVLTFDDGAKTSYYKSDPTLKSLGFNAVQFIITNYSLHEVDHNDYYLTGDELKYMLSTGRWEIQSHGHDSHENNYQGEIGSHFFTSRRKILGEDRFETDEEFAVRVREDLATSKRMFESRLGISVYAFAIPFGDFGQNKGDKGHLQSIVLEEMKAAFPFVFFQPWPGKGDPFNYPSENSFLIKRIDPAPDWNDERLLAELQASRPKTLSYESKSFGLEWFPTWGSVTASDKLVLKSGTDRSGAATFLSGGFLWSDYIAASEVVWKSGSHIALMVRHHDNNNTLSCVFSRGSVFIEEQINGAVKEIGSGDYHPVFPTDHLTIAARVHGDDVACLLGKTVVARAVASSALSQGGIGFKVWDPSSGIGELAISRVFVAPIIGEAAIFSQLPLYEHLLPSADSDESAVDDGLFSSQGENSFPVSVAEESASHESISLPYSLTGESMKIAWKPVLGNSLVKEEVLQISSDNEHTSSLTILVGSEFWTDYDFSMVSDWLLGTSLDLIARYHDADNYVSCSYSNYGAHASLHLLKNGEMTVVGRTPRLPVPLSGAWNDSAFGIRVEDDTVACLVGDEPVLRYTLSAMSVSGGIGIGTWDRQRGSTLIEVGSILVEAQGIQR